MDNRVLTLKDSLSEVPAAAGKPYATEHTVGETGYGVCFKLPPSESRLEGTQLSRTRPRHASRPSRGDARPGAAYPREGPVANAFRSGEIYVPPTKPSGALWASCAAVALRANVHKISRSNGAGMLHAVMYPSHTAHTVVVANATRAFPTMFF